MKKLFLILSLLTAGLFSARAEEITVSATSTDISQQMDLRAVATLFANSGDLEQFERLLNDPDSAFTNLDLNGDGVIDYIRVVETTQGSQHMIVLQAILAKDVYQDVATIVVTKDDTTGQVTMKVVGDVTIYGETYIVEPVFYYRPIIYDWFWGPTWVCWHSPWCWGGYPYWWRPYAPVPYVVYVDRCCHYTHLHGRGSFRRSPNAIARDARAATPRQAETRSAQAREMRDRSTASTRTPQSSSRTPQSYSRTYGSAAVSERRPSGSATSTTRQSSTAQGSSTTTRSGSTTTRGGSTTTRSGSSSTSTGRSYATSSSSTTTRSSSSSTSTGRSYATSSSTTTRSSSSSTSSTGRSSYSSPSTSSRSYSGSSYSSPSTSSRSYSGSNYSSPSTSSRSYSGGSSYGGGGYGGGSRGGSYGGSTGGGRR